jgi:hypothetical protein
VALAVFEADRQSACDPVSSGLVTALQSPTPPLRGGAPASRADRRSTGSSPTTGPRSGRRCGSTGGDHRRHRGGSAPDRSPARPVTAPACHNVALGRDLFERHDSSFSTSGQDHGLPTPGRMEARSNIRITHLMPRRIYVVTRYTWPRQACSTRLSRGRPHREATASVSSRRSDEGSCPSAASGSATGGLCPGRSIAAS